MKAFGLFDAPTKFISQLLDIERFTPSTKAQTVLGWQARDIEGSIIETAEQISSFLSKTK